MVNNDTNNDIDEALQDPIINEHCIYVARKVAYDIATSDPERAKRLLETCIAAGDKHYSTNILALLIQEDNPQKAVNLFERAIAAGDEHCATSNLANLIKDVNPKRAQELYERSILAGNPIRFEIPSTINQEG